MKRLVQVLLFGTVFSVALVSVVAASGSSSKSSAAIPAFTAAQLSTPAGANWVMENGNLQSQRYSSLTQINGSNGGSLKLAWSTHLANPATPEQAAAGNANPIVYNGVMYVQDAWTRITALDAGSGKTLWQFDPQIGLNVPGNGNNMRSLGMGDGMIFTGAYGTVYALNAQTGAQVWATQVVNPAGGGGIDVSPIYYKGLVMLGTTGGDWGGSCMVVALDAKTGAVKWHYSTIPSNPQAAGWNTWPANRYYYGGAAMWDMQSIDPKYDLIYAGTGNPLPFNGLINGPGAEVGTESVYALHVATGKFAWVYQEVHHDIWDYDGMQTPLVETLTVNGAKRDVVTHINKDAYYFALDAQTGKPINSYPETPVPQSAEAHTYPTQPIPQNTSQELVPHVVQHPEDWQGVLAPDGKPYAIETTPYQPYTDQQYLVVSPTFSGGVEWPDPSFDQATGLEYVCANIQSIGFEAPPAADQHPVISSAGNVIQLKVGAVPNSYSVSRLVAFNPATNSIVWKHDDVTTGGFNPTNGVAGCNSPVTTTASGLAIIGRVVKTSSAPGGESMVQAYDASNGNLLWQFPVLVQGKAVGVEPRITLYSIGGKEYLVSFTNFSSSGPDISAYTLP